MGLATVPEAVADLKSGKVVIVVDDEDRENEGDLVVAEHISFMTHHGSGLLCMPIVDKRLDGLGIAPMVEHSTSRLGTERVPISIISNPHDERYLQTKRDKLENLL